MVSAGAVSCALRSPTGPVASSRAASPPHQPETHSYRQTNPTFCSTPQTSAHERTGAVGRMSNDPSLTMIRPARCSASGAPCRGHGFLRSHGPHDQKVNGEWLMSRYRRPEIGRIRNGALTTNQGPSQDLNEPEPHHCRRSRDGQQAPEARPAERTRRRAPGLMPLPRTNPNRPENSSEPEPCRNPRRMMLAAHKRNPTSGESKRTRASPQSSAMKLGSHERTRWV
jgi:hypothetical protein